jgi:HEAT repeat protein
MRTLTLLLVLFAGLLTGLAGSTAAADPDAIIADEKALQAAKVATDGPALLDFFRQRTLTDSDRDKVMALIQKLGDDAFVVREQASADLVKLESVAVALLRRAVADNADVEIVRRAERCLEQIDKAPSSSLAGAAARVLARRKPAGAAQVLLAYLPFADDDTVVEDVRATLTAVALHDGKPERVLLQALQDPVPVKRSAAAEALIRSGATDDRPAAKKLLADPVLTVRLQTALALVESKDREGIPVLIGMLAELPQSQGWQAEELLFRVAGDQAPNVPLGGDEASRKKCSEAWSIWWRDHGGKIDLAKLELAQRMLGHTLVVQMDNARITGRVLEVGADGKPRWQIENLQYPVDAQVLPGNRVLVAEYRNSSVTERDVKGTIQWQRQIANPIACQRLTNGNTFIAARNQIIEVERGGKVLFTYTRPGFDIMSARKLRDGKMALVTSGRQFIRLDTSGKELKSFLVGNVQMFSGFDVLPNNHVLIPQINDNRVVEYDADGKQVWQASAQFPTSAMRLPNGNTLIASMTGQRVVEVNREGREVWSYRVEGRPWRARRR